MKKCCIIKMSGDDVIIFLLTRRAMNLLDFEKKTTTDRVILRFNWKYMECLRCRPSPKAWLLKLMSFELSPNNLYLSNAFHRLWIWGSNFFISLLATFQHISSEKLGFVLLPLRIKRQNAFQVNFEKDQKRNDFVPTLDMNTLRQHWEGKEEKKTLW